MPRRLAAALLGSAVLALVPTSVSPVEAAARQARAGRLDAAERTLVRLVNQVRARHGVAALRPSALLAQAADGHTRDMLGAGFFAHSSSDGTSVGERLARYLTASQVGETLGMVRDAHGPAAAPLIVAMWMDSPPHRQVMLSPRFGRVGIGQRHGRLGGAAATVVTADFASP